MVVNCSAHHVDDTELTNVKLQFYSPNCALLVQPLDQGTMNSVRCAYCRQVIDQLLLDIRLNHPTKVEIFQILEIMEGDIKGSHRELLLESRV